MGEPALYELTACEAASRIREGKLGAAEYARALLARQEQVERRVHALIHFDGKAFLAAAERADGFIKGARARGTAVPPMAGLPIGVKDNIDTKGVPTRAGSAIYRDRVPLEDASCLRALWRCGAYLHSKTVTTELAYFDPGPTRNPWHLAHTPGGSSSGSAAGVAAGLFPIALGTQTAGSVIRPASYNGVVGFVPTHGLVPLDGVVPFARTVDSIGIFARSVDDVALAWSCLHAARGESSAEHIDVVHPIQPLDRAPFLGLVRQYFLEAAEDEAGRAVVHAARHLVTNGAVVHVAYLPESFAQVHTYHRLIMEVEMAREQEESFKSQPDAYGKRVSELIREGFKVPEVEYRHALAHRERFRAEALRLLREVDALLLPSAPGIAPYGLESTGDPRFNIPWTNAGFPVITLPIALSSHGLPIGIQIVGAPGEDQHLLRVARSLEQKLNFGHRVAPAEKGQLQGAAV